MPLLFTSVYVKSFNLSQPHKLIYLDSKIIVRISKVFYSKTRKLFEICQ